MILLTSCLQYVVRVSQFVPSQPLEFIRLYCSGRETVQNTKTNLLLQCQNFFRLLAIVTFWLKYMKIFLNASHACFRVK